MAANEPEPSESGENEPSPQPPSPPVGRDGPRSKPFGFPVVAIGASAGGLQAMQDLLDHLPPDTGMAIVFVQHLSPEHKSSLAEILARHTSMPVREVVEEIPIERNCIYVTPPDFDLTVKQEKLCLMDRPIRSAQHMPIDHLFRAFAREHGPETIAVVLSGTGTDGMLGLEDVKAEGGITVAQAPETASYEGMPSAATSTDLVDFVLSPKQIATELVRIASHPKIPQDREPIVEDLPEAAAGALQQIFRLLRQKTGVDFSEYKQSTVQRRISRRMVLRKVETLQGYLDYMRKTPAEVHALFDEMLINVTSFFRDPDVFKTLHEKIFPRLVEGKDADTPIRIWVPACSTGEEPYSIAIGLLEFLGRNDQRIPIQIFATDVSESLIERARVGRYPESIANDVGEDRLRRFFARSNDQYQVSKTIRDCCVFARQNAVKDPPFSHIDLVSCRNFLIYLGSGLQKRAIPTFHYALKANGFLLLGGSETIGGFADLFQLVDREHKIYAKKQTATRLPPRIEKAQHVAPGLPAKPALPDNLSTCDLQREVDEVLLQWYAPPGVIVDQQMDILHFRGQTGRFLEPSPGAASFNLLRMARPRLAIELRPLVHQAHVQHQVASKRRVPITVDADTAVIDIEVHPLGSPHSENVHYLVVFREREDVGAVDADTIAEPHTTPSDPMLETPLEKEVDRLSRELRQTKVNMQHIIEEHESTNEELRAANEETQSANEELQSTNEELETAKEELQSTNEELSTVNSELESQNAEAARAIDDFNNLHNAVDIPVILLDQNLAIRSFTLPAQRQLGLRHGDQGRRIRELKLGLHLDDLEAKIRDVLESLNTAKEEVRTEDGHWYLMRIHPYRTAENHITGAVLAFVDITEIRRSRQEARNVQILAESIVATVHTPLLVLDSDLKVVTANPAFFATFRVDERETLDRLVYHLGDNQWDHTELRRLLEKIIPHNSQFEGFEITHDFPKIGRHRAVLDARRIEQEGDRPHLLLLAINELEQI